MNHLVLYFTNALNSFVQAINSKCASLCDQMICYLCYHQQIQCVQLISGGSGYGYKIIPTIFRRYIYILELQVLLRTGITLPAPYPTHCHLYLPTAREQLELACLINKLKHYLGPLENYNVPNRAGPNQLRAQRTFCPTLYGVRNLSEKYRIHQFTVKLNL